MVRSFTADRRGRSATYFDEVWEDAEHVLVVTYQDGEWAVVRLGVDGSMEYAVEPRKASMDDAFPFRLQTRPVSDPAICRCISTSESEPTDCSHP